MRTFCDTSPRESIAMSVVRPEADRYTTCPGGGDVPGMLSDVPILSATRFITLSLGNHLCTKNVHENVHENGTPCVFKGLNISMYEAKELVNLVRLLDYHLCTRHVHKNRRQCVSKSAPRRTKERCIQRPQNLSMCESKEFKRCVDTCEIIHLSRTSRLARELWRCVAGRPRTRRRTGC